MPSNWHIGVRLRRWEELSPAGGAAAVPGQRTCTIGRRRPNLKPVPGAAGFNVRFDFDLAIGESKASPD
jgi:hypothetical protein